MLLGEARPKTNSKARNAEEQEEVPQGLNNQAHTLILSNRRGKRIKTTEENRRQRERESVIEERARKCVCEWVKERESDIEERARECVLMCVCVWKRERERVRERGDELVLFKGRPLFTNALTPPLQCGEQWVVREFLCFFALWRERFGKVPLLTRSMRRCRLSFVKTQTHRASKNRCEMWVRGKWPGLPCCACSEDNFSYK